MKATASTRDMPITSLQIKGIHVLKTRLGMTDDEYRALLHGYGVKSSTQLTRYEASEIIGRLTKLLPAPVPTPDRIRMPSNVTRIATRQQMAAINRLASRVQWRSEDGFWRWIQKQFGLKRILTTKDASKVIQGLHGLIGGGHALQA